MSVLGYNFKRLVQYLANYLDDVKELPDSKQRVYLGLLKGLLTECLARTNQEIDELEILNKVK